MSLCCSIKDLEYSNFTVLYQKNLISNSLIHIFLEKMFGFDLIYRWFKLTVNQVISLVKLLLDYYSIIIQLLFNYYSIII